VRLDLTQHHLCKGSCSAVGPNPSFTKHVDIIRIPEKIPQVLALVDFGTTSSFIDQTFVTQHNIHVVKKSAPVLVEVIDGRTIASGAITHKTAPLELRIGKHTEKIVLNIISTPHHPIILGLPWLEAHNPIIDWRSKTLTFSAQRCTSQEPQAQKNTLSSPTKNLVVKNPKKVGTNSNLVKSILSIILPRKPTLSGSSLMEQYLSIRLPRIFKSSPSMSTQPTTKTPNHNQNLSNSPRSTRTLLMSLKRIRLISSPNIVHTTA